MLKKLLIIILFLAATAAAYFLIPKFYILYSNPSSVEAAANRTGLVGWWTMDAGDSTSTPWAYYDKSGSKNTATSTGNPPFETGKIKQGLKFSAVGQKLVTPVTPILNTDTHTITFWLKLNAASTYFGQIFAYRPTGSDRSPGIWLSSAGNCIHWRYDPGDTGPTSCGGPGGESTYFSVGRWYHIAGTKDGGAFTFYVDGAQQEQGAVVATKTAGSASVEMGLTGYNAPMATIDDVRIYDRALSAAEVTQLYNSTNIDRKNTATRASSTPSAGKQLIGYWTMDAGDKTGATMLDKSGNNNHGTFSNAMATSTGKIGQSFTFDGVGDYVAANSINPSDPHHITMSAWIKKTSFTAEGGNWGDFIMVKGNDFLANSYLIGTDSTNGTFANSRVCVEVFITNPIQFVCSPTGALTPGKWYHVVGVISGQNLYIYLNGVLAGQGTFTGTLSPSANTFWIGRQNRVTYSYDFAGQIDDARIYNYALSAQEVANLYNAAKINYVSSANRTGLVGHWTMDTTDRVRGYILDKSGFVNNGTLINSPATSTGKIKQALQFNGSDNYINVPDSSSLRIATTITLAAWVKRTRIDVDVIAEKGGDWNYAVAGGQPNYGWGLHNVNNNMFYFWWRGAWKGAAGVSDFNWHHYVATGIEGDTNPTLYIDGAQKTVAYSSGVATISLDETSTRDLHIGAQLDGSYNYYGANIIDDFRIYNRVFSAQEVANLYNNAKVKYVR